MQFILHWIIRGAETATKPVNKSSRTCYPKIHKGFPKRRPFLYGCNGAPGIGSQKVFDFD